jgi:hypothetical protein
VLELEVIETITVTNTLPLISQLPVDEGNYTEERRVFLKDVAAEEILTGIQLLKQTYSDELKAKSKSFTKA